MYSTSKTGIMTSFLRLASLCGLVVITCVAIAYKKNRRRLPPGPKGTFIGGNVSELPKEKPWKVFFEWGEQYGPIVSFRTYRQRYVVLNSAAAIRDLLDKRSAVYSDRPLSWMMHKLCGRENTVFNIAASNPRHRVYRRMLHTGLSANATRQYWDLLKSETSEMVDAFLDRSLSDRYEDKYEDHIRKMAASVIMMVAYGYKISGLDDVFIEHARETSQITGQAMAPGRWLVESFPLLRFVPAWFPGTEFKRRAREWRIRFDYLSRVPHAWVKQQLLEGTARLSFTSNFLVREDGSPVTPEEEDVLQWCTSGLYAGAADTTVSAFISFVHLMALHRDVQQEAQKEIDTWRGACSECGGDRDELPSFDELDQLPYLAALLKEVLRYAPVGPLALPHKASQDDEYEGYTILKNTTVLANVWSVFHDPVLYPDPSTFDPSRFLTNSHKSSFVQPDPRRFAFGFGARVCPGQQFAEKSMLLGMFAILSRCTISLAAHSLNESDGVTPTIDFTTGHTSHIKSFPIKIDRRQCN